ncbi:MAG: GTP-binding protein [Alphaproteobacteria bacterium]|nr:GTP-binding protein [Alphaproteobacteria bacterium]
MDANDPIPASVIGGYLGAGKTTLVNHLLRHAGGRRLAVLVNEFGDLPIDADLIVGAGERLIAIAGGCVCCAYGSDLIAGLEDLAGLPDRPDHVLIEASGVALPGSIGAALSLVPFFRLDAILVLADAGAIAAQLADRFMGDTLHRQIASADLVLLNKADLVSARELAATGSRLASLAPAARIVPAHRASVPVEIALGLHAGRAWRDAAGAGPTHVTAAFETLSCVLDGAFDVAPLAAALARPELGVLRAKGLLQDRAGRLMVLQLAGGRHETEVVAAKGARAGRLVLIGQAGCLARNAIGAAIEAARCR